MSDNNDVLSAETAAEMRRRRPDMLYAEVPDRGHAPFLDESESLRLIGSWFELITPPPLPDTREKTYASSAG